jgi:hypothetical protein
MKKKQPVRLWIDDFRPPTEEGWTWIKNLREAVEFYIDNINNIEVISFDHDLGLVLHLDMPLPEEQTTMPLARSIELNAYNGIKPPRWRVHSQNPVGQQNLTATLTSADRYYEESLKRKA